MVKGIELLQRRITSAISRFKSSFKDRALILNYHRIHPYDEHDFFNLNVFPDNFNEHLRVLKKLFYPLSLKQLINYKKRGKVPKRAVVVTFDDGYADNLYYAKPLLEQNDFPATVFVTSKYVRTGQEFWWDTLARIFLQPKNLPRQLSLNINKRYYNWNIIDCGIVLGGYAFYKKAHKLLNKNILSRHQVLFLIHYLLRCLPLEERDRIIKLLFQWIEKVEMPGGQIHFPLNKEELNTLGNNKLIEIGSHTDSHPVLSSLLENEQYEEIKKGKSELEDMLNYPVSSFAYPYGQLEDFTLKTVSLVRDVGFSCACSLINGTITSDVSCFQLYRKAMLNCNGEEFEKKICKI